MNTADSPFSGPALDVMEELFFAFTPDGTIVQWNQRVSEVTGYTDEEIGEMHPTEFVPVDERELIERHIENVLEKGRTRLEAHFKTKEGEFIPYEFTGTLFKWEGKTLICGTGRDTSERIQAQKDLETSERRYRRLFEDAQEGIAITTPDGKIVEVNAAAAEIFGYSREELRSMNTTELYIDPADQKEAALELERKGVLEGKELHLRHADGEEIVCQVSTSIHRTEEGDSETLQTFFRDVTDRKRAEEALRESEARYRRLFEESRDAVLLTTPKGAIVDVNDAAEALFGYSREELLNLGAAELYANPEERANRIVPELEEATSSRILEAEMRHSEGHTFLASASVTVHRNEEDDPELIQALVRDITERRKLQREVLQVQEEERKRLGQELHDGIASQLTGANIMLSTLSARAEEKTAERIEEIQTLINESAGDVRRLSRGLNPGGLSEGDLPSALRGLAQNTKGARFESPFEEGLFGVDGENTEESVEIDAFVPDKDMATHLYRIAQEAVTNARKHGEAEGIIVRLAPEESALVLEVKDNGKGFDPQEAGQGSLGLRSMRHRADLLGAELSVVSVDGMGTTIRCRLPG